MLFMTISIHVWLTDCNDDKDDDNVDDDDDVQRRNAWRILTNMDLVFIFLFRFWQQKEIRINIYFLYKKYKENKNYRGFLLVTNESWKKFKLFKEKIRENSQNFYVFDINVELFS